MPIHFRSEFFGFRRCGSKFDPASLPLFPGMDLALTTTVPPKRNAIS